MNTKQKLSYMVVGGIIGVVDIVIGMSVLPVSAHGIKTARLNALS